MRAIGPDGLASPRLKYQLSTPAERFWFLLSDFCSGPRSFEPQFTTKT